MDNSPEFIINRLKKIASDAVRSDKYSLALAAINAAGGILYQWNQAYTDPELEECISGISKSLVRPGFTCKETIKKRVLFYDAFGLDLRGLAIQYVKALIELDYEVVYLTRRAAAGNQPVMEKSWKEGNVVRCYFDERSEIRKIKSIQKVFEVYRPSIAFLYTIPNDAGGIAVFEAYAGAVTRFLINLTDHAFWLGLSAFDYCIEFRNYGATISANYRGIDKNKIIRLPYYPYIDETIEFEGVPDVIADKSFLFSGGSLHKTMGDYEHLYYKLIRQILEKYRDMAFLYAGEGDTTELKNLEQEYMGRVVHISERKDLFELMKRCAAYINTYPIPGGLMMQYAVMAGVPPLTLKSGLGLDAELIPGPCTLNIEFDTIEELMCELDCLLQDNDYRLARGYQIRQAIISKADFRSALSELINLHKTVFPIDYLVAHSNELIRKQYRERFIFRRVCAREIGAITRFALFFKFPQLYCQGICQLFRDTAGRVFIKGDECR